METARQGNFLSHARALAAGGNWQAALDSCHSAAQTSDRGLEVMEFLGVIACHLGDYAKAIEIFENLLDIPNSSGDIAEVLAVLNARSGRLNEALFYGKLATTRKLDHRLLNDLGPKFPSFADEFLSINEQPLLFAARQQVRRGNFAEAIPLCKQHLSLFPQNIDALELLAFAQMESGDLSSAAGILRSLSISAPSRASVPFQLGKVLTRLGLFAQGQSCFRLALSLSDEDGRAGILAEMACAMAYNPDTLSSIPKVLAPLWTEVEMADDSAGKVYSANRKLIVGYLCGGLPEDDAIMAGNVIRHHRQDHVSIILYGHGEAADGSNLPLQTTGVRWRDISDLDEYTLSQVIKGDRVDVLVDLCGLTQPAQLPLFALRPSRIQVAWLNQMPGCSIPGVDFYLKGEAEVGGAVTAQVLPNGIHAFMPSNVDVPARRAELEETGVCFGADVGLDQLNPELILCWARILRATPQSKLLLKSRHFDQPEHAKTLIDLFGNFGVAQKVDIIDVASPHEFYCQVDVALTAFPVASAYQAEAVLTVGRPMVALSNPAMLSQNVASVLNHLGFAERMIARNIDDYVSLAVRWAEDTKGRAAIRSEILRAVNCSPVFNPSNLAIALEASYREMLS